MAHVDLSSNSSVSCAALGKGRSFGMTSASDDTVVTLYVADAASAAASAGTPLKDDAGRVVVLRGSNASAKVEGDVSTYIGFKLVSGTAPTAVWVDGPSAGAAIAASTSGLGQVQLSQAPVTAATPIAVGDNDARVNTKTILVALSGSDGSLAETIVWTAPYNCTITGAYINSSVAMAANNTDYDTFTLQNRPLATPTVPAVLKATTTKAADLNALVAWVEKSLGTLSNASMLQGDILAFKSVASGAGKASGPALLRFTYTVP